jgi:hypothetical protein
MDHEFRRSPSNIIPKAEEMWDVEKEMGIVKSGEAEGLTLERKMMMIMIMMISLGKISKNIYV